MSQTTPSEWLDRLYQEALEFSRTCDLGRYSDGQLGQSRFLADAFGHEMRHVQVEKRWYLCSRTSAPGFWRVEKGRGSLLRAQAVCLLFANIGNYPDAQVRALQSVRYAREVLAGAEGLLYAQPRDFDADPWVLGVKNGAVDLRTGTLIQDVKPLLLTRCSAVPYDPEARCPTWEEHLNVLTRLHEDRRSPGDPELIGYLQELAGVSLVGRQVEHCFVYLRGDGRNGKGVFIDTLRHVLGDHADVLDQTVLFARADAHTTGLSDLQGRRLVTGDEVTGDKRINTALLKRLTGGTTVKARRMRQDNVAFEPTHTLWLTSNDPPNFGTDQSEGLWERVLIVETGPTIPEDQRVTDEQLRLALLAEGPGVLRWAVEGAVRYFERGRRLPPTPIRVRQAVDAAREETKLLERFLAEWGERGRGDTQLKVVRERLVAWAQEEGLLGRSETLTSPKVKSLLQKEGFVVEPGAHNVRVVRGLTLRTYDLTELAERVTR